MRIELKLRIFCVSCSKSHQISNFLKNEKKKPFYRIFFPPSSFYNLAIEISPVSKYLRKKNQKQIWCLQIAVVISNMQCTKSGAHEQFHSLTFRNDCVWSCSLCFMLKLLEEIKFSTFIFTCFHAKCCWGKRRELFS